MSLLMRRRWIGGILTSLLLLPVLLAVGCGGGGGSSSGGDDNDGGSDGASSDPEICRGYTPDVRITSISPSSGPLAGGTRITITGNGFTRCSPSRPGVVFSDTGGARVVSYSNTQIVCEAPAAPTSRVVDIIVSVTNPRGSDEGLDGWNQPSDATKFTYQ